MRVKQVLMAMGLLTSLTMMTAVAGGFRKGQVDVEPRVKSLEYVGGSQFKITYEWQVNASMDKNYRCFVHFTNAKGGIAFQNDHSLKGGTSKWQVGQLVVDGPYTVSIPAKATEDSYGILIGLHNGPRLSLTGLDAGGNRIDLGKVQITRQDGKITGIALQAPKTACCSK
jgi:hypothetical protein